MENKTTVNMMEFGNTPQLPYSVQEAINRLRINISFLGSDVRKIMIISSEPNEGKSFLAMNLWNQMAEAGEKAILIDMDMRNSTMHLQQIRYTYISAQMKVHAGLLFEGAGQIDLARIG